MRARTQRRARTQPATAQRQTVRQEMIDLQRARQERRRRTPEAPQTQQAATPQEAHPEAHLDGHRWTHDHPDHLWW